MITTNWIMLLYFPTLNDPLQLCKSTVHFDHKVLSEKQTLKHNLHVSVLIGSL